MIRAPPGLSASGDQRRLQAEEEEEMEGPMQAIIIPTNSEGSFSSANATPPVSGHFHLSPLFLTPAYLNVNTNATTRGDAQVSGRHLDLLETEAIAKHHFRFCSNHHRPTWS